MLMAQLLKDSNPCRLCAFQGWNMKLTELDLGNNKIGDVGATHLAEALATNDRLRELALDENPIRQAGLHALLQVTAENAFCKVVLPVYASVNTYERHRFVGYTQQAPST